MSWYNLLAGSKEEEQSPLIIGMSVCVSILFSPFIIMAGSFWLIGRIFQLLFLQTMRKGK